MLGNCIDMEIGVKIEDGIGNAKIIKIMIETGMAMGRGREFV